MGGTICKCDLCDLHGETFACHGCSGLIWAKCEKLCVCERCKCLKDRFNMAALDVKSTENTLSGLLGTPQWVMFMVASCLSFGALLGYRYMSRQNVFQQELLLG